MVKIGGGNPLGATIETGEIAAGAVTEAKMTLADNTTGNVSTSKHGFCPKAPNLTTQFLRGDATWAAAPAAFVVNDTGTGTVAGASEAEALSFTISAAEFAATDMLLCVVEINRVSGTCTGTTVKVRYTTNSVNNDLTIMTALDPTNGTTSKMCWIFQDNEDANASCNQFRVDDSTTISPLSTGHSATTITGAGSVSVRIAVAGGGTVRATAHLFQIKTV